MQDKAVNVEMVVQILSGRVANLTTENAMLQARNIDLEKQVEELKTGNQD